MYLSKNKKSGIYYAYYRQSNGKKIRVSTKTKFKKDALKFLNEFENKVRLQSQKTTIALNELKVKYLGVIEITHSRKSLKHSRSSLEKFIAVVGGDTSINHIDKSMCESFILNRFKTAKYSGLLQLRHLKAIFNRAINWGYLDKNPFNGIKLKIPQNHPIFINKNELKLIIEKETNPILSSFYQFAFYTGMRLSEIINLEWDEIDLELKTINVRNKDDFTTKSKKERVIPISNVVYDLLLIMSKKSNHIFSNNLVKLNPDFVSKSFKNCIRNIPTLNQKIHFHTLRHSFASNLAQKGATLYAIKELLGHSNITTTQIYSHLTTTSLSKAINLLND